MSEQEKRPITIVLVDDLAQTRDSIKKLFSFESGFEVIGEASNGLEGVEIVKELKPDIVLMDIKMPDMDGIETARILTQTIPTTGIIMMSVMNDEEHRQLSKLAGARAFLSKPVTFDDLFDTIRQVYQEL